jgi:hypothetical protein
MQSVHCDCSAARESAPRPSRAAVGVRSTASRAALNALSPRTGRWHKCCLAHRRASRLGLVAPCDGPRAIDTHAPRAMRNVLRQLLLAFARLQRWLAKDAPRSVSSRSARRAARAYLAARRAENRIGGGRRALRCAPGRADRMDARARRRWRARLAKKNREECARSARNESDRSARTGNARSAPRVPRTERTRRPSERGSNDARVIDRASPRSRRNRRS